MFRFPGFESALHCRRLQPRSSAQSSRDERSGSTEGMPCQAVGEAISTGAALHQYMEPGRAEDGVESRRRRPAWGE
jgi:hypothetical protein